MESEADREPEWNDPRTCFDKATSVIATAASSIGDPSGNGSP